MIIIRMVCLWFSSCTFKYDCNVKIKKVLYHTVAVCLLMKLIYLVDSIAVNSNREYEFNEIEHIFVYSQFFHTLELFICSWAKWFIRWCCLNNIFQGIFCMMGKRKIKTDPIKTLKFILWNTFLCQSHMKHIQKKCQYP